MGGFKKTEGRSRKEVEKGKILVTASVSRKKELLGEPPLETKNRKQQKNGEKKKERNEEDGRQRIMHRSCSEGRRKVGKMAFEGNNQKPGLKHEVRKYLSIGVPGCRGKED